jgi:hypothetical protein
LDEQARITQKILLSILEGNQKVGDIRFDTCLSPKTLASYLELLSKRGLIRVEIKGWKKGKAKPCFIADAGIKWLINISLNENLQILQKIAGQLGSPINREIFKKIQEERYSRNRRIVMDYFIERGLKGDTSEIEYPDGMDLAEAGQPFREVLKKILSLYLYLISDPYQTPEEIEHNLEKDFILFSPKMYLKFSWHPGAFPELEYQVEQAENFFRYESEKANQGKKDENILKETHLLALETVNERLYEEYVTATNEVNRKLILQKIEDQVGWSVGKHVGKAFVGKEAEIAKYIDVQQRPFLMRFISSFENVENE